MKTVLVTGGTGVLGRELVSRLTQAGYAVRISSRRPAPARLGDNITWAQADLAAGTGITEAVAGTDIVIHAASNVFKTRATDVQGTQTLIAAAKTAKVENFLYVSIIGIDKIDYSYYNAKLAAEELLKGSGLSWSILRATQFHNLIDMFLGGLARLPIMPVPDDFLFQTVDPGEVAQVIVEQLGTSTTGYLPSVTGPEQLTSGVMVKSWLAARDLRRWVLPLRLPGKAAAGFRAGYSTAPAEIYGKVTWDQWLAQTYGKADAMRATDMIANS